MAQTRMFKFQVGDQYLEVIRADGSEDKESKMRTLERIQTFMTAEKNNGTPWKDLVAPFLVDDSPASQALLGSPDYATWKEMFLEINEMLNTECSNCFGTLVQQLSIPSSPFELNGHIFNEIKSLEKTVFKKLGGTFTDQGNYDGGISAETKKIVAVTLEVVARDQLTSIVYPGKDYSGAKKFGEATRTQLATFYNNYAVSTNSNLSFSCKDGVFEKKWSKKKGKAADEANGKSTPRENTKKDFNKNNNQKVEDPNLKRKREDDTKDKPKISCNYCNKTGHLAKDCRKKIRDTQNGAKKT